MNAPIRLIESADFSRSSPQILPPATLIVVTDTQAFERFFHERLNVDVFVVNSAEGFFEKVNGQFNWLGIYADFRQLVETYRGKTWSGQSLWRELKNQTKFASIKFNILAERWDQHQEEWLVGSMGVHRMVRRTPSAVAEAMGHLPPSAPPKSHDFSDVDSHFRKLAGAMIAESVIGDARSSIASGTMLNTRASYIGKLVRSLSGSKADEFLRAVHQNMGKPASESNPATSTMDPWIEAVNKVFASFAGGLGAKVIVGQAIARLEKDPSLTRDDYLEHLAGSLFDRRGEFLKAVKAAKLD